MCVNLRLHSFRKFSLFHPKNSHKIYLHIQNSQLLVIKKIIIKRNVESAISCRTSASLRPCFERKKKCTEVFMCFYFYKLTSHQKCQQSNIKSCMQSNFNSLLYFNDFFLYQYSIWCPTATNNYLMTRNNSTCTYLLAKDVLRKIAQSFLIFGIMTLVMVLGSDVYQTPLPSVVPPTGEAAKL